MYVALMESTPVCKWDVKQWDTKGIEKSFS